MDEKEFLLLLADAVDELSMIREAIQKVVNEGITLYMHEGGEEQKN